MKFNQLLMATTAGVLMLANTVKGQSSITKEEYDKQGHIILDPRLDKNMNNFKLIKTDTVNHNQLAQEPFQVLYTVSNTHSNGKDSIMTKKRHFTDNGHEFDAYTNIQVKHANQTAVLHDVNTPNSLIRSNLAEKPTDGSNPKILQYVEVANELEQNIKGMEQKATDYKLKFKN